VSSANFFSSLLFEENIFKISEGGGGSDIGLRSLSFLFFQIAFYEVKYNIIVHNKNKRKN
jgi:hypothetical protein